MSNIYLYTDDIELGTKLTSRIINLELSIKFNYSLSTMPDENENTSSEKKEKTKSDDSEEVSHEGEALASTAESSAEVEESKAEASDRLKRSFVLAKLAEEQGIEVSEEDIDARISEMFSNAEQEVPESSQNAQMRDYLSRSLLMEETMKKLEGIAAGESEQGFSNQEPDVEDVGNGSNDDNKDQETEEGEVNA